MHNMHEAFRSTSRYLHNGTIIIFYYLEVSLVLLGTVSTLRYIAPYGVRSPPGTFLRKRSPNVQRSESELHERIKIQLLTHRDDCDVDSSRLRLQVHYSCTTSRYLRR